MEDMRFLEEEVITCFGCGEEIQSEEAFEIGDEHFCEVCQDEYEMCRECGEAHLKRDMNYDRIHENYICESCYDDGFYTCEDCGEIISDVECVDEDKIVCLDCIDNYYQCTDCGTYHTLSKIALQDDNEHYICEKCSDNWYACEDCGEIIHENDIYCTDEGIYCQCCFPEHDDDNGDIHDYSYKPTPDFYYVDEENNTDYTYNELPNTMYLGVELEVDNGSEKGRMVDEIQDNMEWIYCKEDGSLDNGIELVTHPCTLEFHLQADYENCFSDLMNNGWKGHDAETCGLHVHINRGYLGENTSERELTIAKIMLVMDRLWDNGLIDFTRRNDYQLNKWAKRCIMEESGEEVTEDKAVEKTKEYYSMGRYLALNLRNSNTIEFRLFRSTLNINTFKATLQFVSNLVDFAKNTTLSDIQTMGLKMSHIINFKQYEELEKYATQKNLI